MITINSFKAKLHPRECKDFIVEHTKVLQAFDIANITSATTDWAFSKSSIIITIRSAEDNQMIGGGRIQMADGILPLPIETAVGKMDNQIYKVIEKHREEGTGEFCGLWNTRETAKMGIGSAFLGNLIIAVSNQLNIKSLFALCAPTTVKSALKQGFILQEDLGQKGTFYYPKLDLVATAVKIPNVNTLEFAQEDEKQHILDLRINPVRTRMEMPRKENLKIQYDLLIK
jgi:hypothetical protein